jgi:hypothetical protein
MVSYTSCFLLDCCRKWGDRETYLVLDVFDIDMNRYTAEISNKGAKPTSMSVPSTMLQGTK